MKKPIVLQTDFGKGIAVSTMHGVINMIDPELLVVDSAHNIPPFNIYAGSTSLDYVIDFWREGSILVSVVDPGVGTARKGAVAKMKNGVYVVTPDNGTLTHIHHRIGIEEIREIDESVHFWPTSKDIAIFHGRDVFAFVAAKLGSGQISFEEVGPLYDPSEIVKFELSEATYSEGYAKGMIDWSDDHFGLVSTNFKFREFIEKTGINVYDTVKVKIMEKDRVVLEENVKLVKAFGDVEVGELLLFTGETNMISIALNFENISKTYGIEAGPDWIIEISK